MDKTEPSLMESTLQFLWNLFFI